MGQHKISMDIFLRKCPYIAIVNEMNINNFVVQEVKNKIKNLRSTYSRELKKVEDSKKSGAGLNSVYNSNIKWLKEMEEVFINELKRKTYENIPSLSQVREQQVPPESGSQYLAASAEENSSQSSITEATTPNIPSRPKKRSREIVKAIHDQVHNEEEETPFDVFGKSVAMQLKKLGVENALLAQQKIQCILTEIGIIDYREKTGNISSTSNYSQSVPTPSSTHSGYNDTSNNEEEEVYAFIVESPESSSTANTSAVATNNLIHSAMVAAFNSNTAE